MGLLVCKSPPSVAVMSFSSLKKRNKPPYLFIQSSTGLTPPPSIFIYMQGKEILKVLKEPDM